LGGELRGRRDPADDGDRVSIGLRVLRCKSDCKEKPDTRANENHFQSISLVFRRK
jgi:hypothetical protein